MKIRNDDSTPVETISEQMREMRPLPIGKTEFQEWSERIISGALLEADHDSQVFGLANMLMHLGPTEDHKPDAHFIKTLRKVAVNQTALDAIAEVKKRQEEKKAAEQAAKEAEAVPELSA